MKVSEETQIVIDMVENGMSIEEVQGLYLTLNGSSNGFEQSLASVLEEALPVLKQQSQQ